MSLFGLLQGWFGRRPRDLEQLIYDCAEHRREADREELFQRLRQQSLCMAVDAESIPAHVRAGERYVTKTGDNICAFLVTSPDGTNYIATATTPDSPMLRGSFVFMEWLKLLEMCLKSGPEVQGIMIQGKTSWIALDRGQAAHILRQAGRLNGS